LAWLGLAWLGLVKKISLGLAWLGLAWFGLVWLANGSIDGQTWLGWHKSSKFKLEKENPRSSPEA